MRTRRRLLASLLLIGAVAPLAVPAPATASGPAAASVEPTPPPDTDADWRADAQSSIDDASSAPTAPTATRLDRSLSNARRDPATQVTVEVLGDGDAIAAAVRTAGGTVGRGGGGLYLATVSAGRLGELSQQPGVELVRAPERAMDRPAEAARPERGPYVAENIQPVKQWHLAGYTGAGVSVGIIALFNTTALQTEISSGELPDVPSSARKCVSSGVACPFGAPSGTTWGNSLAELVADSAPGASLFLGEVGARGDYYTLIDWMAAGGVTIVLNAEQWTYDGPGNGTGPSADIVNYAVSKGIAWFNTAGEMAPSSYPTYGGPYWRGPWYDPDNDRYMNFSGSDESMSVYCGMLLGVRWGDWGLNPTDYDVQISDYNITTRANGTKKWLSANVQASGVGQALEGTLGTRLCNTNPAFGTVYDTNKDGFVSLWIVRKQTSPAAGATGDVIEIGTAYGFLEYSAAAQSITIPFADSANPGMATVGNTPLGTWIPSAFVKSSQGPTNDGRRKPDLVQRGCTSTSMDGIAGYQCDDGFYGSDGAAAITAGYAAVAKAALGIPTPKILMLYMRDNANASGASGQPNEAGAGVATLTYDGPPTSASATHFVPLATPSRVFDSRNGTGRDYGATTKLAPQETVRLRLIAPDGNTATSYVLNVAVVNATNDGWLGVYPSGWSYPGASSVLNVNAGQNQANMVVVPGSQQYIDLHSSGGGHLIVDLVGYMAYERDDGTPSSGYGAGRFRPLEPFRLADSRTCLGVPACTGNPLAAGSYTDITFAGQADPDDPLNAIPADASAVAFSLTVESPAAKGYASVLPGGQSAIATSSLNFEPGKSATTMVFASMSGGVARIFTSVAAHVQVDVLGWFTPATGVAEPYGMFVPMTPRRALDTRPPNVRPLGGSHTVVDLTDVGVPATAIAALVNNVSVGSTGAGEVEVSASVPAVEHRVRNLSYTTPVKPIAAATISGLDEGSLTLTPTVATNLITDVSGYFRSSTTQPLPAAAIDLITESSDGAPANGASGLLGFSDDGSVALFSSNATNLPPAQPNSNVYLWRRADDSIVSLPITGGVDVRLSGDGSTVAFTTSWNLLPEDTGYLKDVYLYTIATGALDRASRDVFGELIDSWDLSSDASTVIFHVAGIGAGGRMYDAATQVTTTFDAPFGRMLLSENGDKAVVLTAYGPFVECTFVVIIVATNTSTTTAVPDCTWWATLYAFRNGKALVIMSSNGNIPAAPGIFDTATLTFSRPLVPPSWPSIYTGFADLATNGDLLLAPMPGQHSRVVAPDGSEQIIDQTTSVLLPDAAGSNHALISADGRYVIFDTSATNMTDQPAPHGGIYIVDRTLL